MQFDQILQRIAIAIIPLLYAITLHEVAHGWVASRFGDNTAKDLHRLSLNPLRHIDIFGTIIIPIITLILTGIVFGWAKPVPVNWSNLRHPRRDMAIVALAGPSANLVMALLWATVAIAFQSSVPLTATSAFSSISTFLFIMGIFGLKINILLMVLNLIPVPPLDGSRVLAACLTERTAFIYEKLDRYGLWIILALVLTGALSYILLPPTHFFVGIIKYIFGIHIA